MRLELPLETVFEVGGSAAIVLPHKLNACGQCIFITDNGSGCMNSLFECICHDWSESVYFKSINSLDIVKL